MTLPEYSQFNCYHRAELKYSPGVKALTETGKLKLAEGGIICDWKVPIDIDICIGQDVTCYGPNGICEDIKSVVMLGEIK